MGEIRFVFFDLGKVLLDFDHSRASRQMARVAGLSVETVHDVVFGELQTDYESGAITSSEFHQKFCSLTNSTPEPEALLLAGSDIFQLKPASIPLVSQLRAINFPMGILSNTCDAHWRFIQQRFPIIEHCFSKRALSFECGCMKPDLAIYQAAAQIANCAPEQIFFTDDRPENVEGAAKYGLQSHLFESPLGLYQELLSKGIQINL